MAVEFDDDDIEYYADLWGVSDEEAELYLDTIEVFEEDGIDDFGKPDPDYMQELADQFDIDISDLYDMYYGYYED